MVLLMFWVEIEQSTSLMLFLYRFSSSSPDTVSRYSFGIFIFPSFFFRVVFGFHTPVNFFSGSLFSNSWAEGILFEFCSLCRDFNFIRTSCSSYSRSQGNLVPDSRIRFRKILFLFFWSSFFMYYWFSTLVDLGRLFCCFSARYLLLISSCSFQNFFSFSSMLLWSQISFRFSFCCERTYFSWKWRGMLMILKLFHGNLTLETEENDWWVELALLHSL